AVGPPSTPEDPRRILGNLVQERLEPRSRGQFLIGMPTKIAVHAVESPDLFARDVPELGDWHLAPRARVMKLRPLLEYEDIAALDAVADSYLVPRDRRHTALTERRQPLHDAGSLHFGKRQVSRLLSRAEQSRGSERQDDRHRREDREHREARKEDLAERVEQADQQASEQRALETAEAADDDDDEGQEQNLEVGS